VPGYVYWPDDRNAARRPWFGLFRSLASGYELWLAGLDLGRRGGGHGRAARRAVRHAARPEDLRLRARSALAAMSTRWSTCSPISVHARRQHRPVRWFLRTDTPGELASRVRDAVEANIALN
jgi:hypothetical protein